MLSGRVTGGEGTLGDEEGPNSQANSSSKLEEPEAAMRELNVNDPTHTRFLHKQSGAAMITAVLPRLDLIWNDQEQQQCRRSGGAAAGQDRTGQDMSQKQPFHIKSQG